MHCVSTVTEYKNLFAPQSKNLSSIIRGYKSAVTIYARKNNIDFNWQPRFHDHIIRTMDDYYKISNYIINNPAKWIEDKFYTSISNDFLK
jgi:putative transposase